MSSTLQLSSMAMKVRKRAMSRQPACPTTRRGGKPVFFQAVYTIASSGFDTMINVASGLTLPICVLTAPTIFTLVSTRSSRLMPGLRGKPAVMMTRSLSAAAA